jgi:cytoskeleton protein RodZ
MWLEEIGVMLRRAREAKGLSVADVQAETRIRRGYLDALERGSGHEVFPGRPYHRAFLKTYARVLGMDVPAVLSMFDRDAEGSAIVQEPTPLATSPVPAVVPAKGTGRATRPGLLTLRSWRKPAAAATLAIFLVTGGLLVAARLGHLRSPLSIGQRPPAAGGATNAPGTSTPPQATPGPGSVTPATRPANPIVAKTFGVDRVLYEVTPSPHLKLTFKGRAWIGVAADGKPVFEGILTAGEERSWTAQAKLEVVIGNGAAVLLWVNGQDEGLAGDEGSVKTVTVRKTP